MRKAYDDKRNAERKASGQQQVDSAKNNPKNNAIAMEKR
jgi:hypothetical protein